MEKLVIQEAHKNIPGIFYFVETKTLEISGRSIPENPELIFKRLDEWMTSYFEKNQELSVNIILEYINSGSSKYLYEILKKLTTYSKSDKNVIIKWFYEEDDDAMLELGEHYRDTAGIPLKVEMIV
jgi:hypothetical protein